MSNLVIVAIPAEDDPVWKISSEKVPHMTILFLGANAKNPNRGKMAEFLLHAANTSLTRFGLEVDRRGTLGEDKADVLFFEDDWELPKVRDFRSQLLKDNNIRTAYDSATQREGEWIPHLTLGYPDSPARADKRDYPGIHWVNFDRIAMWDGEYEGVEFLLKKYTYNEAPVGVGMSATAEAGEEFLNHYGVKGMKWGVRRQPSGPSSADAKKADKAKKKLKEKGLHSLSNEEITHLTNRINMEVKMKDLTSKNARIKRGNDKVKVLLAVGATLNTAVALASSPVGKALALKLKGG